MCGCVCVWCGCVCVWCGVCVCGVGVCVCVVWVCVCVVWVCVCGVCGVCVCVVCCVCVGVGVYLSVCLSLSLARDSHELLKSSSLNLCTVIASDMGHASRVNCVDLDLRSRSHRSES